jgi:hypothetical protein
METIVKSNVLLKLAKRLFGNVVINAYIMSDNTGEAISNVEKIVHNSKGNLRYDAANVVLEFSNGKKVLFENLEWASMELIEEYKILTMPETLKKVVRDGRLTRFETADINNAL